MPITSSLARGYDDVAIALRGHAQAACGTLPSLSPGGSTRGLSVRTGPAAKVEMRTDEPPYALAISLEDPDKPFDDFSGQATLLLGLVANLDEVSITTEQGGYSLSATAASRDLGHDVKQLGQAQSSLVRYLERASD